MVGIDARRRAGALAERDSLTLAGAAKLALGERLPLVAVVASSGADVAEGLASLHGWGQASRALASCSGVVPLIFLAYGPVLSGPALMLGMADVVVTTSDAVAYLTGPAVVSAVMAASVTPAELGGQQVLAQRSGLACLNAGRYEDALDLVATVLDYLPDHTDAEAPCRSPFADDPQRPTPQLRDLLPERAQGSYDVRKVIEALADCGEYLELRAAWAPQLVTALCRVEGCPVGVIANQPQSMAGTLDIAASQKGARFVSFCDAFNLPILTLVDTPGFMPGKDLEWRGMIRNGAQLVFAYAEATVPRVCLILRKAFGGAYIVMDSKGLGNDFCLAWPSAQVAVMGSRGAVQVLHRQQDAQEKARLEAEYEEAFLNPWVAAERGYIDRVIDPVDTRSEIARALRLAASKHERLAERKHSNGPL
jgi:acetyl-CoA carboxylase carboxyltransferase component